MFAGACLVLAISLPVWLPWVLRPLARSVNITYASYDRGGYQDFTLHDVALLEKSVRIRAGKVTSMMPQRWSWKVYQGTGEKPPVFVTVENWEVKPLPTGNPNASTYKDVRSAEKVLRALPRWLPHARLTNGTFHLGQTSVAWPSAVWLRGDLKATVRFPQMKETALLTANFNQPPPYTITITDSQLPLRSVLQAHTDTGGFWIAGTNEWRGNQIWTQVRFARTGKLPETARVEAPALRLPASMLKLEGYQDFNGKLMALWEDGGFTVETAGGSEPLSTNLPPVQISLHARGTTSNAVVERATITLPWLRADLAEALHVSFGGPRLQEPARLRIEADLHKQAWVTVDGGVRGEVDLYPSEGKYPEAVFRLTSTNVGSAEFQASTLHLDGKLNWPLVDIASGRATFEDDSVLFLRGRFDLEHRRAEHGEVELRGGLLKQWLPAHISYEDLTLTGSFSGTGDSLWHTGKLSVLNLASIYLRPLQVKTEWEGQQGQLRSFLVEAQASSAKLKARGAGQFGATTNLLRLEALELLQNGEPSLALETPALFSFIAGEGSGAWSGTVEGFQWKGASGAVQLQAQMDWPARGAFHLNASDLPVRLVEAFLASPMPEVLIENLELAGGWSNSPVQFALKFSGTAVTNIVQRFDVLLAGDAKGVRIAHFEVIGRSTNLLTAEGFLPLLVRPGAREKLVQLQTDAPLTLNASANAEGIWNQFLPGKTNISLLSPRLSANVSGTWRAPQGDIRVSMDALRLGLSNTNLPSFEDVDLQLQLDRQTARLTRGHWLVQGHPVNLTAELPLKEGFWSDIRQKKLPDWREATAHLQIGGASLSAFSELYPAYFSPQGALNVDVSLHKGGLLAGQLTVTGARTRPLPSVGPIRDIDLEVRFDGRKLHLENSNMNVGGAEVRMAGHADISGTNWLQDLMPPFALTVRGTNVPLERHPKAIIRSDLNLSVVHTNGAPPMISGQARLRNSFLLSDLADLVPRDVAKPSRRPPYFSIDHPTFSDWRLGVQVTGTRFLRVRSTLFRGEISQDMKLQGTLKDPIALGTAKIDSGSVRFPFGSLQVDQGFVELTSENPYQPQLNVMARGKQYGYDITMELSGPAKAPVIQFTSTPPLNSEQILLLLTAGEFPGTEFELTAQQRAQTLAMFLGRELLTKLGFGESGEERFLIQSGEEISEAGRPTYELEYKLNKDWSITAEYDRFGDFNVGGKWRFYSK